MEEKTSLCVATIKKSETLKEKELFSLVNDILNINRQTELPSLDVILKICKEIVVCLSQTSQKMVGLSAAVSIIEKFLLRNLCKDRSQRNMVIGSVLQAVFILTSDPRYDASMVTSAVLVICKGMEKELIYDAARVILENEHPSFSHRQLRTSLAYFMCWLYIWRPMAAAGNWLHAFIRVLEEKRCYDVLIEVSLDHLSCMFMSLGARHRIDSIVEVIFYVLASLRTTKAAFPKIAPFVEEILISLAKGKDRRYQQKIVDVSKTMLKNCLKRTKKEDIKKFKKKFSTSIRILNKYVMSSNAYFLNTPTWNLPDIKIMKTVVPKSGLHNLGNTCYMNSILQALFATNVFRNRVVMEMYDRPYWAPLGALFTRMMFPVTRRITPTEVYNMSRPESFNEYEQQDCCEYLIHLLNLLKARENLPLYNATQQNSSGHPSVRHSALMMPPNFSRSYRPSDYALPSSSSSGASTSKRSTKSFVDELFKSVLGTNIHCSGCQSVSVSFSNFHELLVTIPESRKDNVCVQSLIDAYCSSELLTGSAMYNCNVCNGPRPAVRVNLFLSTPKYLIVVMNNFKYDKRLQVQKIFVGSIHCYNEVTLPTWIPMEKTYQLYAAVIHESPFAQTGHYYTLAKDDTEWYLFNDDNVTQVNENYLQSLDSCCTPYLLFYKRTDIEDTYKLSIEDVPLKFRRLLHKRSKTPKI